MPGGDLVLFLKLTVQRMLSDASLHVGSAVWPSREVVTKGQKLTLKGQVVKGLGGSQSAGKQARAQPPTAQQEYESGVPALCPVSQSRACRGQK